MTRASRLPLRALAACGVVAAALAFVVSVPAATTPANLCASLKAWAEKEYHGASPTLDEVATFDRQHRLALFTAVTPEVRAALWKEQFRRVANRADLTPEQRTIVAEAQAMIAPAMYIGSKKEMSATMREFSTRANAAFGAAEQRRLLFDIGAAAGAAAATPRRPSMWERMARSLGRSANTASCECNAASYHWDCGGLVFCVDGPCDGVDGCGMMGQFYCDRVCDW